MNILKFTLQLFAGKVVDVMLSAMRCLYEFFSYKKAKVQCQENEKNRKDSEEFLKKAEKVVNGGTIRDLMDLRR